jgi:hypothetical protein
MVSKTCTEVVLRQRTKVADGQLSKLFVYCGKLVESLRMDTRRRGNP